MEYYLEISLMMSVIFYFDLYAFLKYFLFVFLKQYIKLGIDFFITELFYLKHSFAIFLLLFYFFKEKTANQLF